MRQGKRQSTAVHPFTVTSYIMPCLTDIFYGTQGGQGLDCANMSALLSVLDLVGWQKISSCITAMAYVTHKQQDCSFSLVLEGFETLLIFQGRAAQQPAWRYVCVHLCCHCNPCGRSKTCRLVSFKAGHFHLPWLTCMPCQTSASVTAQVSNLAHPAHGKLQHSFVLSQVVFRTWRQARCTVWQ